MTSSSLIPDTPSTTQSSTALEKIRPDLNLEKWSIWQPAKSKTAPRERIIHRDVELPDGRMVSAEVEVGFTNKGVLTTEDQKTFYALIKVWEDKGKPSEQTFYSLRKLTTVLKKRWGSNVINATSQSLIRLRITPLIWKNSYHDSAQKKTIEFLDPFNILSDLKIIRRKTDGHTTREFGYFRFNDFILKNLLNNYTKPVLIDTVLSFKSEIAQLMYTNLDLVMARRDHFERRTQELFDDLGLEGKSYRQASNRVQVLKPALRELQQAYLNTGVITAATLEKTKDGKDYKVVIRKRSYPELPQNSKEAETSTQPYTKSENHLTIRATELVQHFHKLFHGASNQTLSAKSVDQATALIAKYGEELARYIIDFSHQAAPKTNYHPQTFGGILQYASRACARYETEDAHHKQQEATKDCSWCDQNGWLTAEDTQQRTFVTRCPHDRNCIEAIAQKCGWTFPRISAFHRM